MGTSIGRREFLLLRSIPGRHSFTLSCEWLYMRYVDSREDESMDQLLEHLYRELRDVETLQVTSAEWLDREDLTALLDPIFADLRARGVRIEFSQAP